MSDNIGKIPPDKFMEIKPQPFAGWDLRYYAAELFKQFLISKNMPRSSKEIEEIESISKNISLILWIGKAQILSPSEEKEIIDLIRDLIDNFKQDEFYAKTSHIIQMIKNMSPKTEILEHFTDIESKACLHKEKDCPIIRSEILQDHFEKIIYVMNSKNDKFSVMKLERELKEIKKIFFNDPTQISLLLHNLQQLTPHL
jgi:vacuolar-type H+-ATPase catalytic subunit A/Vma1